MFSCAVDRLLVIAIMSRLVVLLYYCMLYRTLRMSYLNGWYMFVLFSILCNFLSHYSLKDFMGTEFFICTVDIQGHKWIS